MSASEAGATGTQAPGGSFSYDERGLSGPLSQGAIGVKPTLTAGEAASPSLEHAVQLVSRPS